MNRQPLRIVFAGTPEFAAAHLRALLEWSQGDVVAVYSQPDQPSGRGKKIEAPPVKKLALENNLPILQPDSLRTSEAQRQLREFRPDVMVVVAYGKILPAEVLAIPRLGCINVHASILPRWRGAAPIQRAIEAGDAETGVTIMQMDVGLDTGDILNIARCPIANDETTASLFDKLARIGAPALLQTLQQLADNSAAPQRQDNAMSCYAAKINKEEAALDWRQNATVLDRRIRAFNPAPVAYAILNDERVKIYRAVPEQSVVAQPGAIISADKNGIVVGCGDNSRLRIFDLQLPGGKILSANQILSGRAELFAPGHRFDLPDA